MNDTVGMMFTNLSSVEMLVALVIGHAVADYPCQSEFMAKYKAPGSMPGWWIILGMHSIMHGGAVWLITGYFPLFFVETGLHFLTDWMKCKNRINFHTDQAIHIALKCYYVMFMAIILPHL